MTILKKASSFFGGSSDGEQKSSQPAAPNDRAARPDEASVENDFFNAHSQIDAAPAVAAGMVCFITRKGSLFGLDYEKAELKWHERSAAQGAPAVSGGSAFITGIDGSLRSLDLESGQENWSFAPPARTWKAYSLPAPVIAGGTVIFPACDGFIYALAVDTWATKWQFRAKLRSGWPLAVDHGTCAIYSRRRLHVYDLETGGRRWISQGALASAPLLASGLLILSTKRGVQALSARTGETVWSINSSMKALAAAEDAGMVLLASLNLIRAVDLNTGEERWRLRINGSSKGKPAYHDGVFYLQTSRDLFHALDAFSGRVKWSFPLKMKISPPVVARDRLIFGGRDGYLYSLSLKSGDEPPVTCIPPAARAAWQLYPLIILTGIFYEYYWFYRNWKQLGGRWNSKLWPGQRLLILYSPYLFALVYIFVAGAKFGFGGAFVSGYTALTILGFYMMWTQLKDIQNEARGAGVKSYRLFFISSVFFTLSMVQHNASQIWFRIGGHTAADFLGVIAVSCAAGAVRISALVRVQNTLNRIWQKENPGLPMRRWLTSGEKKLISVFSLLVLLTVAGVVLAALHPAKSNTHPGIAAPARSVPVAPTQSSSAPGSNRLQGPGRSEG
ncbi:MAG: outer membrane protein assembly factor BamB family protein [Thermoleophilia bacterium]